MPGRPRTAGETWTALQGLDDDLLDPAMPDEFVSAELQQAGVEPEALKAAAARLAAMSERADRLAWQARASRRRDELEARLRATPIDPTLPRAEVLRRIEELRAGGSPGDEGTIRVAARKRRAEESTDEELRALLQEMQALRALEGDDSKDP